MEPEPANLAGDQKRRFESRWASTKWVSAPSLPFDLSSWQGQSLSSAPEFRGFIWHPPSASPDKAVVRATRVKWFEGFTLFTAAESGAPQCHYFREEQYRTFELAKNVLRRATSVQVARHQERLFQLLVQLP